MDGAISSQGRRVLPSLVPVERELCRSEVLIARAREKGARYLAGLSAEQRERRHARLRAWDRARRAAWSPERRERERLAAAERWRKFGAKARAARLAEAPEIERRRAEYRERMARMKADPVRWAARLQRIRERRAGKRLARDLERLIKEATLKLAGH